MSQIELGDRVRHRISAMIYLNFDINSDLCVCHHCDNPPCFNPEHLFIGTQKGNIQDMFRKGRENTKQNPESFQGERNSMVKLSSKDVINIRKLAKEKISQYQIAEKYSISQSNVSLIKQRKRWRHL